MIFNHAIYTRHVEGVEVLFECLQLTTKPGHVAEVKRVTPKVLKNTELQFISPNLLDWWAIVNQNKTQPCRELGLSVTLVCAGARDEADIDTSFEMSAVEGGLAMFVWAMGPYALADL